MDAGFFCKFDVRPDTDRHDHEIGADFASILEPHPLDALLADDLLGFGAEDKIQAALRE